jgi:hypothetical protein
LDVKYEIGGVRKLLIKAGLYAKGQFNDHLLHTTSRGKPEANEIQDQEAKVV